MTKFQSVLRFCQKPKFILTLILIVFFFKGVFIVALFPIFQGPDEQLHYSTAQYYAEPAEKEWEIVRPGKKGVKIDGNDIGTYNFSEEIKNTAKAAQFDEIKFKKNNIPSFSDNQTGFQEEAINNNSWKRQITTYPPNTSSDSKLYFYLTSRIEKMLSSQSILTRFFSIRLFSVFLGTLVIFLTYLISRKIGFSEKIALLLSGIIAFQPMFSFMTAVVNPDALLFFDFTLFLYGAVSLMKEGFSIKNILIILTSIALGIFTKGPAIVLVVIAIALFAYIFQQKTKLKVTHFFGLIILISIITVSICFAFIPDYVRGITKMGSKSAFESTALSLEKYLDKTLDIGKIKYTVASYWGNFGWLDTKISSDIVDFIFILEIIAFSGALWYLFSPNKKLDHLPEKKYLTFFALCILALQLAIRFYDWRAFDIAGKIVIDTPGRYFMPNISAHFILLFSGLAVFLRKKEHFEVTLKSGLILMVILQFYAIFNLIIPRYYL